MNQKENIIIKMAFDIIYNETFNKNEILNHKLINNEINKLYLNLFNKIEKLPIELDYVDFDPYYSNNSRILN